MGEKALLRACKEMHAANKAEEWDGAEIVGSPAEYWLGDRRIAARTVEIGMMLLLFHSEGIGTDYEQHTLNERGREFAETGQIPSFELKRTPTPDGRHDD